MSKIRIMIADDHSMVREGLKQLVELEDDIIVVAQAGNGNETIEKIIEYNPDVVLLDINMPERNGLEVLTYLKQNDIVANIIILTIHNEVEYLYKAVEIGVKGYVLKDSESDVLIRAIRSVYEGETYIQPNMASLLFKKMNNDETGAVHNTRLTKREVEVLKLITEGLLNKEIAHRLCISEKTVKNHVSNIFKKIEVSDRTQAAVFAIKNAIVELF
ncbi:two-component response regulator [Petrocella atlantisensis]|uniref:Stage 0 sporulation protein A homolog n=1 Tax=Petrocella atlantisensis TaxID=2173034 RepID=A0A3P7RYE2_9FIRM|nr:response regulator transcription factor [Petrocella atlantisensis]PKM54419.1 MAG: DNA-binding response regulator [Firmicutes bacterium HGW-Firmicutes-5]VDN47766.1 two-component response regulator [Petrocella atlantisensis]